MEEDEIRTKEFYRAKLVKAVRLLYETNRIGSLAKQLGISTGMVRRMLRGEKSGRRKQ